MAVVAAVAAVAEVGPRVQVAVVVTEAVAETKAATYRPGSPMTAAMPASARPQGPSATPVVAGPVV